MIHLILIGLFLFLSCFASPVMSQVKPKGVSSKNTLQNTTQTERKHIGTQTDASKTNASKAKSIQDQTQSNSTPAVPVSRASKKEDDSPWRIAPFPLLNYNSGTGLGYGAFLSFFKKSSQAHQKGARHDFALNLQYYSTTRSYSYHKLMLDAPRLNQSGLRIQLMGGYESWDQAWFFGVDGSQGIQLDLMNTQYYQYQIHNFWMLPSIIQPIQAIHPAFAMFFSACLRWASVHVYPNSLLSQQQVVGKDGGDIIQLSLGLMWDSRDRDPDTRDGLWTEFSGRYSDRLWGSEYEMWGFNITHRQWIPMNQTQSVIWAYRLGIDYQGGHIPFFQRAIMGGSQWVELGGNSSMRGYRRGRLLGDLSIYYSQEVRWTMGEFHIKKRPIAYQLTPIIDVGYITYFSPHPLDVPSNQMTDSPSSTSFPTSTMSNRSASSADLDFFDQLYTSFGLGARFIYDESFILRLDFAMALERITEGQRIRRQLLPAFFAIVNHTF